MGRVDLSWDQQLPGLSRRTVILLLGRWSDLTNHRGVLEVINQSEHSITWYRIQIVTSDAPAGALLTLPQQLFLFTEIFFNQIFYDDHRHCLTWLGRGWPGSQTQWVDTRRGCHAPGMMMWEADLCSRGWCLSWSLAQIRSRVVSCLPCVGTWDLAKIFDKTWLNIFSCGHHTHLKEFWCLCWRSVIEHLAQFVVTLTRTGEWRPRSETWQIFSSVADLQSQIIFYITASYELHHLCGE